MKRKKIKKTMNELLVIDESYTIHRKKGNGLLSRQVWKDGANKVTRYSLAYINHEIFQGDNGRVLGYDNSHNHHHRHFMGKVESIVFVNFEELEIQFMKEFEVLHEQVKKKQ